MFMVSTETPICDFGWKAPDFSLEGVDGKTYSLENVRGANGTVIMFICNHCPYVKAIIDRLVRDVKELQAIGIGVVAIMSNDPSDYPEDSFENMKLIGETNGFTFPYIIDKDTGLQYRGRLDSSRKEPGPTGARRDLVEAMSEVAKSGQGPVDQTPSMGCSIKWIGENA
jgi:thiol-disulfide isomerase/thioredoxin